MRWTKYVKLTFSQTVGALVRESCPSNVRIHNLRRSPISIFNVVDDFWRWIRRISATRAWSESFGCTCRIQKLAVFLCVWVGRSYCFLAIGAFRIHDFLVSNHDGCDARWDSKVAKRALVERLLLERRLWPRWNEPSSTLSNCLLVDTDELPVINFSTAAPALAYAMCRGIISIWKLMPSTQAGDRKETWSSRLGSPLPVTNKYVNYGMKQLKCIFWV